MNQQKLSAPLPAMLDSLPEYDSDGDSVIYIEIEDDNESIGTGNHCIPRAKVEGDEIGNDSVSSSSENDYFHDSLVLDFEQHTLCDNVIDVYEGKDDDDDDDDERSFFYEEIEEEIPRLETIFECDDEDSDSDDSDDGRISIQHTHQLDEDHELCHDSSASSRLGFVAAADPNDDVIAGFANETPATNDSANSSHPSSSSKSLLDVDDLLGDLSQHAPARPSKSNKRVNVLGELFQKRLSLSSSPSSPPTMPSSAVSFPQPPPSSHLPNMSPPYQQSKKRIHQQWLQRRKAQAQGRVRKQNMRQTTVQLVKKQLLHLLPFRKQHGRPNRVKHVTVSQEEVETTSKAKPLVCRPPRRQSSSLPPKAMAQFAARTSAVATSSTVATASE